MVSEIYSPAHSLPDARPAAEDTGPAVFSPSAALHETFDFIAKKPRVTAAIFAATALTIVGITGLVGSAASRLYENHSAQDMRAFEQVLRHARSTDGIQCVRSDGTEDHYSPEDLTHRAVRRGVINQYRFKGGDYTDKGCHGAEEPEARAPRRAPTLSPAS